ncbi:MAG: hypothetical protein ACRDY0_02590 [Acidimicrobiales bacterium]
MEELARFRCPRCDQAVEERFYGPCRACRMTLAPAASPPASTSGPTLPSGPQLPPGPAGGRYEPKAHVVPNHVATKD